MIRLLNITRGFGVACWVGFVLLVVGAADIVRQLVELTR